jgi:zinc/manganese transport system ATP-binding protein
MSLVRLRDVAAGYGPHALWRGLDLDLSAGEFLVVLGGNGAGKTTLMRVLLGLHPVMRGDVEILGGPPHRGNARVGYLPQLRSADADVAVRGIDLVRLGLDGHRWGPARHRTHARERVRDALDAVGGTPFAGHPLGRLSGGEQQRVRLAQAIVGEPALLLADEPLLSLDLAAQRDVTALLDAHRRRTGMAVVLVSHEINPVLPYVDRVLYLAGGTWASGTPDEVLTSATLSRLYGSPIDVLHLRDRIVIVGADDAAASAAVHLH